MKSKIIRGKSLDELENMLDEFLSSTVGKGEDKKAAVNHVHSVTNVSDEKEYAVAIIYG
jgi:hypothetical protein